jgi:RNA polymerase sigma-70 factor (ECF subfamily)
MRNEHLGRIRKSARQPEVPLQDVHELSEDGFWLQIDHQLVHAEILTVVDKLPEEYRLAVVLCDIEGMTRQEAAISLEISEGTINSRLHRGRNLLRAQLARSFGEN